MTGRKIHGLTGVYHADGGVIGELSYVVGKITGSAHCALCDITHGGARMKKGFAACQSELPVKLELVHLNERSPAVRAETEGNTPCVVAHSDDGLTIVLSREQLDGLDGSVGRFRAALEEAVEAAGLSW